MENGEVSGHNNNRNSSILFVIFTSSLSLAQRSTRTARSPETNFQPQIFQQKSNIQLLFCFSLNLFFVFPFISNAVCTINLDFGFIWFRFCFILWLSLKMTQHKINRHAKQMTSVKCVRISLKVSISALIQWWHTSSRKICTCEWDWENKWVENGTNGAMICVGWLVCMQTQRQTQKQKQKNTYERDFTSALLQLPLTIIIYVSRRSTFFPNANFQL